MIEPGADASNRVELTPAEIEVLDGGPPGRVAPVEHIEEPLSAVKARVESASAGAKEWADWAFSCWVVNTDLGDAVARNAASRGRYE